MSSMLATSNPSHVRELFQAQRRWLVQRRLRLIQGNQMTVKPANEASIRDKVRDLFKGPLGGPGRKKLFINEMDLGSTRADLMMVTPFAHVGIEIKSGLDNMRKLEAQIPTYELYCDQCWLVIHPKHAKRVVVPDYWGVIVATNTPRRIDLEVLRAAEPNPMPYAARTQRIAGHLWAQEVKAALKALKKRGYSNNRKFKNVRWLCQSPERVRPLVYAIIRARGDWRRDRPWGMRAAK